MRDGAGRRRGTLLAAEVRRSRPGLADGAGERGFTLIELVVVVAIVAALAALAGPDIAAHIGRYRLNGAARELLAEIEACRLLAITENREYALQLVAGDPTPEDPGGSDAVGVYRVMAGNASVHSNSWDVLPVGDGEGEGAHDLASRADGWPGISLESWTPLHGPEGYDLPDALVFSPRGILANPGTDLQGGEVRIVLRDKRANPRVERRAVLVRAGGDARLVQPE